MKMNKLMAAVLLFCVCGLFAQEAAPVAVENEKDWTLTVGGSWESEYFSKGRYCNVDPVFELAAEATWKGVYLGVYGYLDATDANDYEWDFEEYDFGIGYSYTVGGDWDCFVKGVDLGLTYWRYKYPRANASNSYEFDFTANADCFLNPGIEICWDYENNLFYGNFNATYKYAFNDTVSWKTKGQIWWGNSKYLRGHGDDKQGFLSALINSSLNIQVLPNLSVGPFVKMGWGFSENVRDTWKAVDGQSAFNFTYGLSMYFDF